MAAQKNEIILKIGETCYTPGRVIMKCHGLGSCVALFLFDVNSTNSAGAHIMMPGTFAGEYWAPDCYASNAVNTLVHGMKSLGTHPGNIRAKVVGGGNVARMTGLEIGKENVTSVVHELRKHSIEIDDMEVGGTSARTVKYCSETRDVYVTLIDI